MAAYLEFNFKIKPLQPWNDILMAELIEIGFDSFTEEYDGILGYIQKDLFKEEDLKNIYLLENDEVEISYTYEEMPNINWNEEWEKNFSPINVEDKVLIRAEFHEPNPEMHEGCGTSVLAIFAKQKGAGRTVAIDIDEWSVENSKENAQRNNVELDIELGTADNLGKEKFEIILANINRNILISDIPTYVSVLEDGGKLLLSGLCFFDVDDILEVCIEQNLKLERKIQREEWVSLLLSK